MVAAHNRVIVYGTLTQMSGGGSEIFDFGWADSSSETPAALAAIVDTVMAARWESASSNLGMSAQAVYGGTRVEAIDSAGKVTSSYNKANTTGYVGLNATKFPTITCAAVSLETGAYDAKGTLIRGRFYPPAMPAQCIGSTFSNTDMGTYIGGWAALLKAINTAGGQVAVASSTSVGLVTVTGVSCDNVVDTQRRRKNHVTVFRSATSSITP